MSFVADGVQEKIRLHPWRLGFESRQRLQRYGYVALSNGSTF